jgi:hypothetical protein
MFFQLLFIHLFRPFLKYTRANSPLPAHVSPRKFCTHSAAMISKLLRMYKKTHGLKQICNIAVYIAHSACTIHLLNLPDKNSVRDIVHGVKHLEEIGEGWLCARRTLAILSLVARRWKTGVPEEVTKVFLRNDSKFSLFRHDRESPKFNDSLHLPAGSMPPGSVSGPFNPPPTQPAPVANGHFHGDPSAMHPATKWEPSIGTGVLSFPPPLDDPGRNSRPDRYIMPHDHEDLWNLEEATPNQRNQPEVSSSSSSSALFGGIESLVAESQGWWLRDHANFFDNWYGPDQAATMIAHGLPHDLALMNHGMDSYGLDGSGPGRPAY